jgi:ribonuclease VapC
MRSGAPRRETGPADAVARAAAAEDATISSVTYAQVLHKTARLGVTAEDVDAELGALIVSVSHFGRLDARSAASFPGDRSGLGPVCPALARSSSSLAYAADRVRQNWVDDLGVDARVTR